MTKSKFGNKSQLLVLTFLLLACSGFGQTIDSILYHPYENVDSIAFWHKLEIRKDNNYMTYGLIRYSSCDYHSFLQKSDYNSNDTIPTSEGFLTNDIKNGEWTYWNDVTRICCDEFHLYPDSTIIYENGLKVEKQDRLGTYHYWENKIRVEIVANGKYPFSVECDNDRCEIIYCDKFVLKEFNKDFLEMELIQVSTGDYIFEGRKAANEFKEKQEKMNNNNR